MYARSLWLSLWSAIVVELHVEVESRVNPTPIIANLAGFTRQDR
jgi:hypothetical protein